MSSNIEKLLGKDFNGNAPATAEEIALAERTLGQSLPSDFREFLQLTNGGEGMIGENYVMLWSAEELGQYNEMYQVKEYTPGLLLFGSDGGGEGYAFDARTSPPAVVMVPFIGMALEYATHVADSFDKFLIRLANSNGSLL